jgi:hypothetical protein
MQVMTHENSHKGFWAAVRNAAQAVQDVLTDHPFFDWRWAIADIIVIGVWIAS